MIKSYAFRAVFLGGVTALAGCLYVSTQSQIDYGLSHYKMGLYGQAIPPLVSAAESLEKEKPPKPQLVDVLVALGDIAEGDKRNDLASDFYGRALKAAKALQPEDKTRLRNALVHTGQFYFHQNRIIESMPLLQRAADISATFEDHEFLAMDLDNEASAYQSLKQYDRAIELQLNALRIANQLPASKFPTRGTILHNLGHSYMELGQFKEAEQYFAEALAVLNAGGREVEPWRVKIARTSYATLLRKMGRRSEAEKLEALSSGPGALPVQPRSSSSAGDTGRLD